ncbi:class I SAM-dependent DNA methyltransferase [Cribrihabitans neustonicus]|uniref:class I SAM-dependent DNA methyltransferase n=1 Tax=Cribrihabitans neustonicus TaxID=1429085 RepID=UPI003B58C0F2
MGDKFLDRIFGAKDPGTIRELYESWASSYEDEIGESGYATPARIAAALWKYLPDPEAPVLDYGCGTGLAGLALRAAGYRVIDGLDPSPKMLDRARDKGIYRKLDLLDLNDKAPVKPGSYRAIVGCGVLGTGAAPPATFDVIMHALGRKGLFAFSYNDHALEDRAYTGKLNDWLDCSAARLLFRAHGDHLPGINLKSTVYVIEKA